MGLLKQLAKDLKLIFQLDFYGTGNGKGLVDGVGGVLGREYGTVCVKSLGADARKCNKVAEWINSDFHEFEEASKISRMKVILKVILIFYKF